ncbi:MAG: VOC family protein [Granulicella sp.]
MANVAKDCRATVIPGMRYRDAVEAMDWLEKALGFERHAVYMNSDGKTVEHAEMVFGNGMIMLGSASNGTPYSPYSVHPQETGGRETRSTSLIVSDAKAIYATAKAAGAEMIFDLREMDYGGWAFTCRDPEGFIWSIGSYDPWEPKE